MKKSVSSRIKRIAVLTSGGDAPGMNAAVRSVVRYADYKGMEVFGVIAGYRGLINDDFISLNRRSVSNIIGRGGTILKTARSEEFLKVSGRKKAMQVLNSHKIDALVAIGGDGTYRGAHKLYAEWGIPVVGVPGTIDNDIFGTDKTIGSDTAVGTALDAIDKIRDTATSLERIYVVEVMGRHSGFIAINVALGAGAEECLLPERKFDLKDLAEDIKKGYGRGKVSWIIVVAEGAGGAADIAKHITQLTGFETRVTVLGHIQRGGYPTAPDRVLATRLGAAAIDILLRGYKDVAVGIVADKVTKVRLSEAAKKRKIRIEPLYRLIKILI